MVGNQLEADRKCCGDKTEYITLLKSKKNTRKYKWHISDGVCLSVVTNPNDDD